MNDHQHKLYKQAFALAIFTIIYNVAEGLISIFFGIADAQCTRVCVYMSVVLLVSSIIYELTGIGWIDVIGTLGLAWFSFSEGRECFEKIRNDSHCGCSGSCKEKL
jgi:divalent metal cation (Fe/Co/Zn/Cd) transporter